MDELREQVLSNEGKYGEKDDTYNALPAGAWKEPTSVTVNFEGRDDMFKKLEKDAKESFRTLEGQILFELASKT